MKTHTKKNGMVITCQQGVLDLLVIARTLVIAVGLVAIFCSIGILPNGYGV